MLHRNFKPAKCKTALKLAAARIKLLKNKRDAQIKHLKRELAQLLESGQEQTARIRVEHVVREEKTMAAYDLVEIYCELIVARLPIIESQKNCPIDLKEAITSVIFAAPRCADIPELMDVRKHFTAKYGKEFISSALELRPDCGVSRMLVEKLSAKAPDGQTKIKILTAIAEEHNVKWDPNSFGGQDAMPPEDLLNGPNTFETASRINVEPPSMQVPPNRDQRHDAPVNLGHNVRSAPSSQSFASTDVSASKTTMSGTSHSEVRPSGTGSEGMEFRHSYSGNGNAFPSNGQNWNMDFKDATSAAQAAAESAERASMAARAAAELSSYGKITRQYSTESKSSVYGLRDEGPGKYAGSNPHGEHLGKNSVNNSFHDRNPRMQNEQIVGHEQDNLAGVAERRYTNSHSKKSSQAASRGDDTSVNSLQKAGGYSQRSSSEVEAIKPENSDLFSEGFTKKQSNESVEEFSSEMQDGKEPRDIDSLGGERFRKQSSGVFSQSHSRTFGEGGMMEQSSESEEEFSSEMQYGMKTENVDYFGEQRFRKQSSGVSSRSHSRTFNHDDYDVVSNSNRQKFGNDAGEDPMVGMDRENIQTDTRQTQSHGAATVLFDESGSDDDDSRFDVEGEHNRRESNLYFTSPDRKSPTHLSANTNPWSSRQTMSESLGKSSQQSLFSTEGHSSSEFSESLTKSAVPSQPDGLMPVTFDDSDGPSSESEEEMNKSKLGGTTDHSIFSHKENAYFGNPEPTQSESRWFTESSYAEETNSGSNRKPWLHSSSDVLDSVEVHPDKNQGAEFNVGSLKKSGFGLSTHQSQMDSNDMIGKSLESSFDEGKPGQSMQYSRHSLLHEGKDSIDAAESHDTVKDTEFSSQSTLESEKELNLGMLTGGLRNKGLRRPPYTRNPSSDASSSSKQAAENAPTVIEQSTAAPQVKTSVSSESYDQKASTKVDKKSRPSARVTYFDSNNDDSVEELPQQTFRSNREPYEQKAGIKINNKSSRSPTTFFDSNNDDSVEDLPQQTFRSNREPYEQKAGIKINNKSSRSPATFFDSDNDDSEEDLPKQNLSSKGRLGSGFSRRTKAASSSSEKRSYSNSKGTAASEVSVTSDHGMERKPSRSSYATETPPTAQSQSRGTGHRESSEQPRSAERASSKPMPESKFSLREESMKSSAIEQPSSPLLKVASGSTESSSRDTPSRESSLKKASHVHPNLPDYDTLAARIEFLRSNRK